MLARWLRATHVDALVICIHDHEFEAFRQNVGAMFPHAQRWHATDLRNTDAGQIVRGMPDLPKLSLTARCSLLARKPVFAQHALHTPAQVGCASSHYAALSHAAANVGGRGRWTIIFEWDATVPDDFEARLANVKRVMEHVPDDVGCVWLGARPQYSNVKSSVFTPAGRTFSSHAMAVRNDAAQRYVDALTPLSMAIDDEWSRLAQDSTVPKVIATHPMLFTYSHHASSIGRTAGTCGIALFVTALVLLGAVIVVSVVVSIIVGLRNSRTAQ